MVPSGTVTSVINVELFAQACPAVVGTAAAVALVLVADDAEEALLLDCVVGARVGLNGGGTMPPDDENDDAADDADELVADGVPAPAGTTLTVTVAKSLTTFA